MIKTLYIMCGPPASGKTTWVKEHLTENGTHISRDEIRFSMLKNDDDYFTCEKEVLKTFYSQIQKALDDNIHTTIYADATHITSKARVKFLNHLIFPEKVDIIPIWFNTPVEVCIERNAQRNGRAVVPESVIREMCEIATAPAMKENKYTYTSIITVEHTPKTWVTSDMHFGHDKEFIWRIRGFNSVEEMNNGIIERWNSMVRPEDEVYVLGDLIMGTIDNISFVNQLNGKLHIALGNHDTQKREEAYQRLDNVVEVVPVGFKIKYKKINFIMTHWPTMIENNQETIYQTGANLYGHTHQQTNFYEDKPCVYHVGMDSHDCYPVLLDDVVLEIKEKIKEYNT